MHASTILPLKGEGEYLAAWFEGSKESARDVAIRGSRRIGGKWEPVRTFAKVNPESPHWNPVLRRADDGRIELFFKVGRNCADWRTYVQESRDEGRTWSAARELVAGDNPSGFKNYADSPMRPVEQVSWDRILGDDFLGALRQKTGLDALDLPTEAQWEYACRAGTKTGYSYGDDANGDYMWFAGNSTDQTHAVGTKRPNAWDLYDMHGNVWEWCLDLYDSSGSYRVKRGGSWYSGAVSCTSSSRNGSRPSDGSYFYGFRLVRTLSNNLEGERSAEAVAGAERAGMICS